MSTNIGPKIGIDGEAQYRKQINNIIQQANTLASEMKAVTAGFDASTTAQEKAAAKSGVLTKQIKVQEDRVAELSKMLEKSSEKYGENDSKTLKWQQALNNAKADLLKMERELREATEELEDMGDAADDARTPIRRAGDAMEDAGNSAFSFGDALKAGGIIEGGKAVLSLMLDLIESTQEYRSIMASLDVSSARNGYTAEQTAESYALLYGVLGDEQSSATALANLQAMQLDQETLETVINGTIGAWTAYGDSIPIDGLAEAINETVKVGKVTGTFADVLNWAGASEDEFNAKLEACADSSERMKLVLQELTDQGLVELGEEWQNNNRDIVDNNRAVNDLNKAYSRFAKMAAPAVNKAQQGIADALNDALDWWEANEDAVKSYVNTMDAAEIATVENAQAMNDSYHAFAKGVAESIGSMIQSNAQAELSAVQMSNTMLLQLETMRRNAAEKMSAIGNTVETTIGNTVTYLMSLPDKAYTWGSDMLQEFGDGVLDKLPSLEEIVEAAAAGVSAYLHFSVPDVGPLSDADEYGPDFMELMARGIRDNIPQLTAASAMAAEAMVIQPQTIAGGSVSSVNSFGNISVNVYASEGQSVYELADVLMERIQEEVTRKEEVYA